MRKPLSLASIAALLAVVALSGAVSVNAQSQTAWTPSGWVSSGTLFDLTGNSNLASGQPLVAGHSYNMTLLIKVPISSTSTKNFSVSLNPEFGPATGQSVYWALHTPQYAGYNRTLFTASERTVDFDYSQGSLSLSAYFQIPVNFTIPVAKYSTPSGNGSITLHLPQNNVIFVSVVPAGSSSAGSFSASVYDQTIQTYLTDYNQTADLVPSGKISSTFQTVVNSILAQAQALFKLGLPDNGTALLNTIVPSAFPVPPSGSLQTELLVGLAVAIVVIVLLAVMMMRSRGKSGYSVGIINDVQKDLAVLEVTAAKYDKAMADKLKALRDKLSESS
ncbi:MAG TPA: hypothetical protein VGS04_06910 [Nitrososphaerales archaeon]|nr:hypothetical protein [Nitrososphaerales archaeon]